MSIIRRIKNLIIIKGMNFLSLFSTIKVKVRNANLENNKKAWGKYASGLKYIENQPQLTDIKYGQETPYLTKKIANSTPISAAFNACEVIALQNALIALNINENSNHFPELLSYFEKKGAILKGYFGTAPRAIINYLKSNDIIIKKLRPIPENFGKTPIQILVYQNGKKLTSGIHTICILSNGDKPHFLNGCPDKNSVPILLVSLSKHIL